MLTSYRVKQNTSLGQSSKNTKRQKNYFPKWVHHQEQPVENVPTLALATDSPFKEAPRMVRDNSKEEQTTSEVVVDHFGRT